MKIIRYTIEKNMLITSLEIINYMFKRFVLILLCISSCISLGKSNKIEKNVSANVNNNDSLIEKKKISSNDKQLKPAYLEYPDLTLDLNPSEKSLLSLEPLLPNNKNIQPKVISIQDNFEELNRVRGDDIHTARQRELIQNSWLGGFFSRSPTTLGEKIQDKWRELYIQQGKAKKSPK